MLIALEGLPGAGKTTSVELVADRLGGNPLQEATQDHPFLESVYDDDRRHDLEVELAFLLLHAGAYRRADRSGTTVTDYSPAKDVLFARDMLYSEDLDLWLRAYHHFYRELPLPDLTVFLRLPPEECLRRVRRRGRDFEARMTMERLQRMQSLYESNLESLGQDVAVLDVRRGAQPDDVADAIVSLVLEEKGRS
jgi:deoxyadenosine/deoxycytidine kinase